MKIAVGQALTALNEQDRFSLFWDSYEKCLEKGQIMVLMNRIAKHDRMMTLEQDKNAQRIDQHSMQYKFVIGVEVPRVYFTSQGVSPRWDVDYCSATADPPKPAIHDMISVLVWSHTTPTADDLTRHEHRSYRQI